MEYSIRSYQDKDFKDLNHFLNDNLEYDIITENVLWEKLYDDPHWDPQHVFICHQEDQVIGFMQGVIRDNNDTRYGYIKLMAVEKTYRRRGIARALYQELENTFIKADVNWVRIYDVPMNYLMPGIDPRYTEAICFAVRMGFQKYGDTANLMVDLDGSEWDTRHEEKELARKGVEMRRPNTYEQQKLIDFVRDEWELWVHEINRAFANDPPTIFVAYIHGAPKGFSAYNANNNGTGWFGPMGTHPDLRGNGVGGVLLKKCLKYMKAEGYPNAIIPWVGPIDFYAHHANARVTRVFWRYEKQLKL